MAVPGALRPVLGWLTPPLGHTAMPTTFQDFLPELMLPPVIVWLLPRLE